MDRYEEARERAKKELKTCGSMDCAAAKQIFRLFPELEESEDERIRKAIQIALSLDEAKGYLRSWGISYEQADAYLEKQKELERIVPEREATDFEIEVHEIIAQARSDKRLADKDVLEQFEQEAACSLMWKAEKQKEQKPIQYDIDVLEKHITKDSVSELAHTVIVRNGWEIVEKEQMPAECSEEDKKMLKETLALIETVEDLNKAKDCFLDVKRWLKSLPERINLQPKQEWSEEDEENFKWFDKLFRAESIVIGGRDIPQDKYLWFKSLRPVKQEWSEEDENMKNHVLGYLNGFSCSWEARQEMWKWINSIPERINFQPKQEWSEEDEKMLVAISKALGCDTAEKILENEGVTLLMAAGFLASLRPQPHWKPSEKQMYALARAKGGFPDDNEHLRSLYEQLKKL